MEDLAMTGPTAELHSAGKIGAYLGCDPALLDQALAGSSSGLPEDSAKGLENFSWNCSS